MSALSAGDQVVIEEKYTVRKADGEMLAPGTFFVIRQSDMFAVSGLWSYAHALASVLDLADSRPVLTEDEYIKLRSAADRASELAAVWQSVKAGRLPD